MSNLATKAPNFTPETAREMGKRGGIARSENIKREKLLLAELEAKIRQSPIADSDEARKARVAKQIDALLNDMERTKSLDVRLRIGAALERLWKLVQPTAGVNKPSRSRRPEAPRPSQTPQEPSQQSDQPGS